MCIDEGQTIAVLKQDVERLIASNTDLAERLKKATEENNRLECVLEFERADAAEWKMKFSDLYKKTKGE